MTEISKWVVETMLKEMPEAKKQSLRNASRRNGLLTSEYSLEHIYLRIYKEGWYLTMEGCRCQFAVWAFDNDGEFVFGRKPSESKLHHLWSDGHVSWYDIGADEVCWGAKQ